MRLRHYIVCLLLPLSLLAGPRLEVPKILAKGGASGGGGAPSYLISENCDGTGTPSGWNDGASTINWDYTTSPAPLEGTQSLLVGIVETYDNFTANGEVWGYFMANWSALNTRFVASFRDSGDNKQLSLRLINDGSLTIYDTSQTHSANTGVGTISAGTAYHVWIHALKGSGANQVVDVYISTTSTKPGSPSAQVTNGTGTVDCSRFALEGWNDGNYIYDKVRVDDASIGSNPT